MTRYDAFLSLLLWICLTLTGCSGSSGTKMQTTAPDGNVVTTYDDPEHGVRLTYPGDWQEESIPVLLKPKGTIIVLVAPSDMSGTKMPPTVSVVAQDANASPSSTDSEQSLDEMQKQVIDKASKQFGDFHLIESGPAALGGEPARRVVYTGSKLGVSLEVMNVFAIHNARGFAIAYSADPEIFAANRPAVEQVIASLKFMK